MWTKTADEILAGVLGCAEMAREKGLVSDEHFTIDGTLMAAWASLKSFQPKEGKRSDTDDDAGNTIVNFRGDWRSYWKFCQ